MIENELFRVCPSGFLPGDTCSSQVLSIIHKMQKSFDESLPINVRVVFSDNPKTFDKKSTSQISGSLLKLIKIFSTVDKQG